MADTKMSSFLPKFFGYFRSLLVWEYLTVRFKNFRVENFRDLPKTFEVFEIHVYDPGLKTFEVFVNNLRFKNF